MLKGERSNERMLSKTCSSSDLLGKHGLCRGKKGAALSTKIDTCVGYKCSPLVERGMPVAIVRKKCTKCFLCKVRCLKYNECEGSEKKTKKRWSNPRVSERMCGLPFINCITHKHCRVINKVIMHPEVLELMHHVQLHAGILLVIILKFKSSNVQSSLDLNLKCRVLKLFFPF